MSGLSTSIFSIIGNMIRAILHGSFSRSILRREKSCNNTWPSPSMSIMNAPVGSTRSWLFPERVSPRLGPSFFLLS
jgi:hypothetical protein